MNDKYSQLQEMLREMNGVTVAFSGGVDSTFLIAAAREALGDRTLAVIGRSPTYPDREYQAALRLAEQVGVRTEVIDTDELSNAEFRANPPHRCFVCKTTLFSEVRRVAEAAGLPLVLEGSNADDVGDFRPGMDAARKLGVRAPLKDAGLTKQEIRDLSRKMGLPTWNKPAAACLSSRIPYGEEISEEKLSRIERAEAAVRALGVTQLRVRDHGSLARIEVEPGEIGRLAGLAVREQLVTELTAAGYQYVCLDLAGYRSGAMNEVLGEDERKKARQDR